MGNIESHSKFDQDDLDRILSINKEKFRKNKINVIYHTKKSKISMISDPPENLSSRFQLKPPISSNAT